MEKEKKKQIAKISVFITSIFVIFLSVTYAFINMTLTGTRRQVIIAGNLQLELNEDNQVTLMNAMPMYDEVGMVQDAFTFRLVNKTATDTNYTLKLVDITTGESLNPTIVKYGLTKDDERIIASLSSIGLLPEAGGGILSSTESPHMQVNPDPGWGEMTPRSGILDEGVILGNQTIEYSLRLWIDSSVEDNTVISEKSLSYRIDVEVSQDTTTVAKTLLASMKQGDYVSYEGNNGCKKNDTPITGTDNAESGNSCLGYNANDTLDTNSNTYGYCYSTSYKYTTTGWRIAYIEGNQAYLISAGSPECNHKTKSVGNVDYIKFADERALKYCNSSYVDGDCSDNSDSWAVNDSDFYKMTSIINNGQGRHLVSYYGSPDCWETSSSSCGLHNDLIDNGGFYWFAATYSSSDNYGVNWFPNSPRVVVLDSDTYAYGLRPIIKLSSSVYVTGGKGTLEEPYQIAND